MLAFGDGVGSTHILAVDVDELAVEELVGWLSRRASNHHSDSTGSLHE